MNQNNFEPRLYIVMREDLWDMNPGKGMAQAAHAQADFDAYGIKYANNLYIKDGTIDSEFLDLDRSWRGDLNFGVTIIVSAPLDQFKDIELNTRHRGIVVDPTYPYRNYYGKTFTTWVETCMWVFATAEEEIEFMKKFPLHS